MYTAGKDVITSKETYYVESQSAVLLAVIGKSSGILRTPSYVQFNAILTVVEFLVFGTAQTTRPSTVGTAMPLRCSKSLLDFITSCWEVPKTETPNPQLKAFSTIPGKYWGML